MKIRLTALLGVKSQGVDKVAKKTGKIKDDLNKAEKSSKGLNKNLSSTRTGTRALERSGGRQSQREYRGQRGIAGTRAAGGRNFSGLAGMADGGGAGSLVAGYAELAANIFAVTAAFQALSDAAKVEQLTQGLELMGARGGVALKSVAKDLKEVTGNAISTADAMRVVAQASSAGLGQDEITRLGKVAKGASLALGRDMSDSMDRLTRGVIKLEPELLDELGIMVRLDQAVKTYAEQNGKAASALTLTERNQAFLNAALEEGESKFGEVAEQIGENPYDKLSASVRDLGTQFFTVINGPLKIVAEFVSNNPFLLLVPGILLAGKAINRVGLASVDLSKTIPNAVSSVLKKVNKETISGDRIATAVGNKRITNFKRLAVVQRDALKNTTLVSNAMVRMRFVAIRASIGITVLADAVGKLTKSVLRFLGPMLLMSVAFFAIEKVGSFIQDIIRKMQGLTKEIIEARKELKDFNDSTAKTLQQLDSMKPGEQFDALITSLQGARGELKKLQDAYAGITAEQQTQAKLNKVIGTTVKSAQNYYEAVSGSYGQEDLTLNQALKDSGMVGEGSQEERKFIAQTLVTLEKFAPERAKIVEEAIKEKKTAEEIREELGRQLDGLDKITGRYANINSLLQEASKNISDLTPKEFESSSTKLFDNFIGISNEIDAGAKNAQALADEFIALGSSQLQTTSNLVALYSGEGIYSKSLATLKQIESTQSQINKLSQSNNILNRAAAEALKPVLALLKEMLGVQIEQEQAEAKANLEKAKQTRIEKSYNKTILSLQSKAASLDKQKIAAQVKLNGLKREEITSQEGSLVFGILDKTALLEDVEAAKTLIDNELKNALLDIQDKLAAEDITLTQITALEAQKTLLEDNAQKRKDIIDIEGQAAQQEIANLGKKLQSLVDGNEARKQEIAHARKVLSLDRSIASERQKLASAQLEGERIAAEIAAGPQGLTKGQEADFAVKQHQLKIDNLNKELEFLEREQDLKLRNLEIERTIRETELKLLKDEINRSGLSETEKTSLTNNIDTILTRSNDYYTEIENLERDLAEARKQTLNQQITNEEARKGAVPTTPEERAQQALAASLPQRNVLGLSGAAEQFYLDEMRTLGDNATKEDEKYIRGIAVGMEEAAIAAQGFNDVVSSIETGLQDAFMSIVDGSKSATQAFADMAKAVLAQIAQIIVKLLVVRTLNAIGIPIPGAGGGIIPTESGAAGGIIGYANGGIISPRDGLSGVVRQPTYLVGEGRYNEAVVPLPNGRAIPVQMHGGQGGQQNNVAVTVNMNDNGSTQTESGFDPNKLGQAISVAVQKELMAQKSPGGLLSKYG